MSGLGAGEWGLMPYGSGSLSGASSLGVAAVLSQSEVLVQVLGWDGTVVPCQPGNPGNGTSWAISRVDGGCAPFVQTVVKVSDEQVMVVSDRVLCPGVEYTLTLQRPTTPLSVNVWGLGTSEAVKPVPYVDDGFIRDIANPATERDIKQAAFPAVGTYEVTDSGDLGQDGGLASLRKRILRRVATALGDFFHLPGYGGAVEVKRLSRPDTLRRLQDTLRAQVKREPEVVDCSVAISQLFGHPDVIIVRIVARTAAGNVSITEKVRIP